MKNIRKKTIRVVGILLVLPAGLAYGGGFDLSWRSIDGGGAMSSTGGGFELSGTIGQLDANAVALAGGSFEITGGFWAAAVPVCACPADVSNDGLLNGADIQGFVDCLVATGSNCVCADVLVDGLLDLADVTAFVNDLISGAVCP